MKIVYWSGTGNTEAMANYIAEGIRSEGKDVEIINVSNINKEDFLKEDLLILGCPAMGDENLEESEFEPFIDEISNDVQGKKVALFGSYGWGDGQWMRDFSDRMSSYGCEVPLEPLIMQYDADEESCKDFGKKITQIII